MRRRTGFTLVELLVAMALIVFVMVILTQAFGTSMQTFRLLKAMGDMDARLRGVTTLLRDDLTADHFEGKRRTSDDDFWTVGSPRDGYLRISNGNTLVAQEGGADNIASRRVLDDVLQLTVKKRGNNRSDFFAAQYPADGLAQARLAGSTFFGQALDGQYQDGATTYTSQWAEVAYFLAPNGASTSGGLPLYGLYRRQRLLVPRNADANNTNQQPPAIPIGSLPLYADYSVVPNPQTQGQTLAFNSPADVTNMANRLGNQTSPLQPLGTGSDLLLTDVVSFEVVPLLLPGPMTFAPLTGAPGVFDTAVVPQTQPPQTLKAVRVTLRIWDFKTEQTRQITIIQDL